MRTHASIAILLLGAVALWSTGSALDFYVDAELGHDSNDGSQDSPWQTITHALASVEGSEEDQVAIQVAAGTYSASTNGETFPLCMKSWVSLSGDNRETTILDAEEAAYHVIYCEGVDSLAIEGLAISGGRADGPEDPDLCGGGIYCYFSSPMIRDNTISGNQAKWGAGVISWFSSATIQNNIITDNSGDHGGGIYFDNSSSTLQETLITGNSAQNGGGIYCLDSSVTVTDCEFRGNGATTQHQFGGGGVFCMNSPITIDSCSVTENAASAGTGVYSASGGGMLLMQMYPTLSSGKAAVCFFDGDEGSSTVIRNCAIGDNVCSGGEESAGGGIAVVNIDATIESCLFGANSAGSAGGGIAWAQITYYDAEREPDKNSSQGLIRDCVIEDNVAGLGAGIGIGDASPHIANCLFSGNSASLAGGALALQADAAQCSPDVENCTISGNVAGSWGGGAIYCSGAAACLENSILWGDEDDIVASPGEILVSYSCVQGGYDGEGNIPDAPMFVEGPFGGYYLHTNSPCIDVGSKSAEEAGLSERTTQADGTPDTGTVDIGYHYPITEDQVDVQVTCSMNAAELRPGDTLQAFIGVENRGSDVAVDIFAVMILPDGSMFSLTHEGFAVGAWPWFSNLLLPSGFTAGPETVFELTIPPDVMPGGYTYVAAITEPGMGSSGLFSIDQSQFEIISGTDIKMVSIPAGSFLMGSPEDEEGRYSGEGPQRTVNVSPFEMSQTEVTESQWEDVMGWNECRFKRGANHPAEMITWFDCVDFCNKLSVRQGLTACYLMASVIYDGHHIKSAEVGCHFGLNGYRLPTEAEWEYACRAGTATRFYTGDSESDLGEAGWYDGNSDSRKHEVGSCRDNAFGLYDMHGNVYEWCWDFYDLEYYGKRPDPDTDPTGPDVGSYRILRGGSWGSSTSMCRSANRLGIPMGVPFGDIGFRVVRSVRPDSPG